MSPQKQFLTKAWYEKRQHELSILKEQDLPHILSRLKEASEQGDISENAEYDEALASRDILEARISELESLLNNVEIIQKTEGSTEVVYGSVVTFSFNDTPGKEFTVDVVWSGEVEISKDVLAISFQSPLGRSLRWAKKGDVVSMKLNTGERKDVTILEVN